MKAKTSYWTSTEYSLLRRLVKDGEPVRHIVRKLNRDYESVLRKIEELGLDFDEEKDPVIQNPAEVDDVRFLQNQLHTVYPVKGGYCINGHIKTADVMKEMAARIKRNQEILSR